MNTDQSNEQPPRICPHCQGRGRFTGGPGDGEECPFCKAAKQPPTPVDLEGLRERLNKSHNIIGAMCKEGRCPAMFIPARPDVDEDLIMSAAIRDALAALDELTTARQRIGELEGEVTVSTSLTGKLAAKVDELERETWRAAGETGAFRDKFIAAEMAVERGQQRIMDLEQLSLSQEATITSQSAEIERMQQFVKRVIPVLANADGIIGNLQSDSIPKTSKLAKVCRNSIYEILQKAHDLLTPPPQGEEVRKDGWLPKFKVGDRVRSINGSIHQVTATPKEQNQYYDTVDLENGTADLYVESSLDPAPSTSDAGEVGK